MRKIIPFSLTAFIILIDQLSKAWIAANLPLNRVLSEYTLGGDLLWIIHVRNKAVAFSLGSSLPDSIRPALFIILPIAVLTLVTIYYFRSKEFTFLQRWAVAGIIGGGLGNIIDRIFRPDGVVDFVSVKFFGILGMDRWPTFNIADASVVVCCIVLLLSILFDKKNSR